LNREQRTDELAPRRRLHESVHPAVLISFPMQQDDAAQLRRIEHLADGPVDRLEKMMHPGVNQGGTFIGNEELIKRDTVGLLPGGDPVNSVDDLVNARATSVHTIISELRALQAVSVLLATTAGQARPRSDSFAQLQEWAFHEEKQDDGGGIDAELDKDERER
jgi:hypothetical protein